MRSLSSVLALLVPLWQLARAKTRTEMFYYSKLGLIIRDLRIRQTICAMATTTALSITTGDLSIRRPNSVQVNLFLEGE
jgi:hypothetical protein